MPFGPHLGALEQGGDRVEVPFGGLGQERIRVRPEGRGAPPLGAPRGVPDRPQERLRVDALGPSPVDGPAAAGLILVAGPAGRARRGHDARRGRQARGLLRQGLPGEPLRQSRGGSGRVQRGEQVLIGEGLGGAIQAQTTAQASQIQRAQADQGAGEQVEGAGPLGRRVRTAEAPGERGPGGRQNRPGGRFGAQQHRRCGGRQGHAAAAQLAGHDLGTPRRAHDDGHGVPGRGAVDALAAQHAGDVRGLLGGRGGDDDLGSSRAPGVRLIRPGDRRLRLARRRGHQRPAVGGGAGHRDPSGLIPPHGVQRGSAPVDGVQGQALGGQARVVLGLHEQARGPAAEGLDGDVGVPQHDDPGAAPGGVGTGQGGQESRRGGGAVLVVIDHDQIGHGGPVEDARGVPVLQGLDGAVLDASGVQPARLRAPPGGGPALRVPRAQEGRGRAPDRDPELASQGGEAIGVHLQLPGARQEVAHLGAEGPGGDGLGRQARPLPGIDEIGERRVLLGPGEQDRGRW